MIAASSRPSGERNDELLIRHLYVASKLTPMKEKLTPRSALARAGAIHFASSGARADLSLCGTGAPLPRLRLGFAGNSATGVLPYAVTHTILFPDARCRVS